MSEKELLDLIHRNLFRVDRIFHAVDFGKVCMTAELVTDMYDFYYESKKALAGHIDTSHSNKLETQ